MFKKKEGLADELMLASGERSRVVMTPGVWGGGGVASAVTAESETVPARMKHRPEENP